jgi:hypothetical protein
MWQFRSWVVPNTDWLKIRRNTSTKNETKKIEHKTTKDQNIEENDVYSTDTTEPSEMKAPSKDTIERYVTKSTKASMLVF